MKRLKGIAFALALPWSQNLLVAVLLFSVYFETSPSHFGRLLVVRAAAEYQVALR